MKVLLTAPPDTHAAYRQMVAAPPDGVEYLCPRATRGSAAAARGAARLIFGTLRLPNLRLMVSSPTRIDVVHSCQHLLLTRLPWVVDIEHGQPFVGIRFSRLRSALTRAAVLTILRSERCRAILPWTETAFKAFVATFGSDRHVLDKTRVIYPAVAASEMRQGSPADACRLLFVSNNPAYNAVLKGGRELVEAFDLLRRRHPTLSLTIVGPTPPLFEERCRSIPGIVLTGRLSPERVHECYRAADIYVMPSFSDTFGMVYLEAMANGLPVVALDRPYTREIVRDGETGLLLPMTSHSLRWFGADGRFTMDSDRFIGRLLSTEPDPELVRSLCEVVDRLVADAALRRRLSAAAHAEVRVGRFSVTERKRALFAAYSARRG